MMEGGFRSGRIKASGLPARGLRWIIYSSATMGTRMAWVSRTDIPYSAKIRFESSVYPGLNYSDTGSDFRARQSNISG